MNTNLCLFYKMDDSNEMENNEMANDGMAQKI